MTSKRYLTWLGGLLFGIVGALSVYDFTQDDFGLFWSTGEKRLWTLEKTSKYLMSYRYVPQHFDGLLIGPSYSDGFLDTRQLHGYRIYNLSMEGGNATELRAAAVNAIERGHMHVVVICLAAYLTKDHGMKGPQINAKEYWGSLFSWLPIEMFVAKWQAHRDPAHDLYAGTEWGAARPLSPHTKVTWDGYIRMQLGDPLHPHVDPLAYQDLRAIIDAAHAHGVRVLAYFYPYDHWRLLDAQRDGSWQRYQQEMRALFDPQRDAVVDMTTDEFMAMRFDIACYTDEHLSPAGAKVMIAELQRLLDTRLKGVRVAPTLDRPQRVCAPSRDGSGFDRNAQQLASELLQSDVTRLTSN